MNFFGALVISQYTRIQKQLLFDEQHKMRSLWQLAEIILKCLSWKFAGRLNFIAFIAYFFSSVFHSQLFSNDWFEPLGSKDWNSNRKEKKYRNSEIENIKLPRLKIMEQINCFHLTARKQPINIQRSKRRRKKKTKCKNALKKQSSSEIDIRRNLSCQDNLQFSNVDDGQQ